MAETLTAQQRANLFAMSTRQNLQMMAKQKVTDVNTSMTFTLPRARYLSNIFVKVAATINAKHATLTNLTVDKLSMYNLVRRWSLDLNNGFMPWAISGAGACALNMIQSNADMLFANSDYCNIPSTLTSSAAGTDNKVVFTVQLPVTLNQRDPVGLILLQTENMVADLRVDVGTLSDVFPDATGYTLTLKDVECVPMLETFSVPASDDAKPDLSVLKLCSDRVDTITGSGQQIIKLSTGTIYRKLLLYITDENGKPVSPDFVTSTIDLVFNEADCNYRVEPAMLRAKNAYDLGCDIPKGLFIFDLSNQGTPNLGGMRDYIDTEKLSEFWVRFNTNGKGKVRIISETLARLV